MDKEKMMTQDEIDFRTGEEAYNRRDFKTAVKYLRKAAKAYNRGAIKTLGYCYSYGSGVKKNKRTAKQYWERAAILGDANALYKLGDMYRNGDLKENLEYSRALYYRAYELTKDEKDYNFYPDAVLRLLKHCGEDFTREEYRILAEETVYGFKTRMENSKEFYTKKLYDEAVEILESIEK